MKLFDTGLSDVPLDKRIVVTVEAWPQAFIHEHQERLARAIVAEKGDTTLERLNALTGLTPADLGHVFDTMAVDITAWPSSVSITIG